MVRVIDDHPPFTTATATLLPFTVHSTVKTQFVPADSKADAAVYLEYDKMFG